MEEARLRRDFSKAEFDVDLVLLYSQFPPASRNTLGLSDTRSTPPASRNTLGLGGTRTPELWVVIDLEVRREEMALNGRVELLCVYPIEYVLRVWSFTAGGSDRVQGQFRMTGCEDGDDFDDFLTRELEKNAVGATSVERSGVRVLAGGEWMDLQSREEMGRGKDELRPKCGDEMPVTMKPLTLISLARMWLTKSECEAARVVEAGDENRKQRRVDADDTNGVIEDESAERDRCEKWRECDDASLERHAELDARLPEDRMVLGRG
ncbi:hypothetical protein R3P38DRAFT_3564756 [Favolaschia claudopus]|uniref:Uncharacterized protein n=1 Tax=Favolaschia claudopus TaxID=2862362 RepID=A0AAW0DVN9_9AGAR